MLIVNGHTITNEPVAVRVEGERITNAARSIAPTAGELVIDARGGTVIPGLHDHHLHLRSTAAWFRSVPLGPPVVKNYLQMRTALSGAPVGDDGWIRAVGYHESVAGDLTRSMLDMMRPDSPVRVQHRSGAMWILNSAGLAELDMSGHLDGRLFRLDHHMPPPSASATLGLDEVSGRLLSMGVTGCTDATPNMGAAELDYLESESKAGRFRQKLHVLAMDDGRGDGVVTFGPVKRILDDTHLDLDELTSWVSRVHACGQSVAVHCVTLPQLVITVAAFRSAGVLPGDRVEHAAVAPDELVDELAALRITVVTQPNFVSERGDHYQQSFESREHCELWRVASFDTARVPLAGSTDAPFGALDPWAAMRAARDRTTPSGSVLGPGESVSALRALNLFTGSASRPDIPRRLEAGAAADICILDQPPAGVLAELSHEPVVTTIIRGAVEFSR